MGQSSLFHELATQQVQKIADVCGDFLKWESQRLIHSTPTPEEKKEHRTILIWLLRITRYLLVAVSDPEFPEPALAKEIAGRLHQLEDSWDMFYKNPLSLAEADKLLRETFPE